MDTFTIHSVAEYVDMVCQQNTKIKTNGKKGDTLLFRGQADKENLLIPSIGRHTPQGKALIEEERNMIEMAKYKLPTVFRKDLEPIELLALLQHHGIPTRLLDVSENALVGLYFACHDDKATLGKDGEVIVFISNDLEVATLPRVNTICNSYKDAHKSADVTNKQSVETNRKTAESNEGVEIKRKNAESNKGVETNLKTAESNNDIETDIMFVYAPSYSLRQNIQRGRYILFEDSYEEKKRCIREIPKNHRQIAQRIIVPADLKKSIRKDLRLLGVSKELLFLDNTDMVCREIAERFSER
ncbi:MAG: FRG domain-containing protein [Lachnospiraceae bacterium]